MHNICSLPTPPKPWIRPPTTCKGELMVSLSNTTGDTPSSLPRPYTPPPHPSTPLKPSPPPQTSLSPGRLEGKYATAKRQRQDAVTDVDLRRRAHEDLAARYAPHHTTPHHTPHHTTHTTHTQHTTHHTTPHHTTQARTGHRPITPFSPRSRTVEDTTAALSPLRVCLHSCPTSHLSFVPVSRPIPPSMAIYQVRGTATRPPRPPRRTRTAAVRRGRAGRRVHCPAGT